MSRLLIFGDSFGEESMVAYPSSHYLHEIVHRRPSFHSMLRESQLFSEVIVLARGGSNLFSQYKLFQQKYQEGDQVLWFVTHPGRLTFDYDKHEIHIASLIVAEQQLFMHTEGIYAGRPDNDQYLPRVHAAIKYYKYLQRDDYDSFVHQALKTAIQAQAPSTLFVRCFPDYFPYEYEPNKITSLVEIFSMENRTMQIIFEKIQKTHWDLRRNHLTEPNHYILTEQLLKIFKGEQESLDYSAFIPAMEQDNKYYFLPIQPV